MGTSGEYLTQADSFMKQGTYMGLQEFLFLLHHKFGDRGLLLAKTIFPALAGGGGRSISETEESQADR